MPITGHAPARTSSASAPRLPDAGRRRIPPPAVKLESSRFPCKERACMPGSTTTPGRPRAGDSARRRTAFRYTDSVGTREQFSFAAPWLACTYPCRRFADILTDVCARLGADVARYTFIAVDLHHLLLAGLPAHLCENSISVRFRGYPNDSRPQTNRIQSVLRGRLCRRFRASAREASARSYVSAIQPRQSLRQRIVVRKCATRRVRG
jgi:hypothetical protein